MRYEIIEDPEPLNPLTEFDGYATITYRSTSRYKLGNERVDPDWRPPKRNCISLPVYASVHGGSTISTKPFSDPWDSGQSGWVYLTREQAKKLGIPFSEKSVWPVLEQTVSVFNDYLTGNCWGYRLFDDEDNEVDSCWGFLGDKSYCEEQAKHALETWQAGHPQQLELQL